MQTHRITVQRESNSQTEGFSPQSAVMEPGDAVFWYNEDRRAFHQPVPDDPANGVWVANPIGPGEESDQANFFSPPPILPYHCKFHPDETGSLNLAAATNVTRGTDNTVTFAAASIDVGGYVWWRNLDSQAEHQPAPDEATQKQWFNSPVESGARSTPIQFDTAGTVNYHCALHPGEKGVITISAVKKAGG